MGEFRDFRIVESTVKNAHFIENGIGGTRAVTGGAETEAPLIFLHRHTLDHAILLGVILYLAVKNAVEIISDASVSP